MADKDKAVGFQRCYRNYFVWIDRAMLVIACTMVSNELRSGQRPIQSTLIAVFLKSSFPMATSILGFLPTIYAILFMETDLFSSSFMIAIFFEPEVHMQHRPFSAPRLKSLPHTPHSISTSIKSSLHVFHSPRVLHRIQLTDD
jgi:hypothetical protein